KRRRGQGGSRLPPPKRRVQPAGVVIRCRQVVPALLREPQPEIETPPERLAVDMALPLVAQVDPRHGAPHVSMQIADAAGIIRGRSVFPPPPRPPAPGFLFHVTSPPSRRQPPRRVVAAYSTRARRG